MLKKITDGIVGNLKAAIGADRAKKESIDKRWSICKECPHYKMWLCQECGCIVSQKIKIASESCPLLFWEKEDAQLPAAE